MGSNKLKGKDLRAIEFHSDKAKSLALSILKKHYKFHSKQEQLTLLQEVFANPQDFADDTLWHRVAEELIAKPAEAMKQEIPLREEPNAFEVFGRKHITSNAFQQMRMAMRLPIAESGALMPDAHQGYGLPIGGVLATKNTVIPYGVGVDIGCRMSMSIYDVSPDYLKRNAYQFKMGLKERTNFGTGGELNITQEHEILDRSEFQSFDLLRQLHGKAVKQLGTSGSGNHFVEWGVVRLFSNNALGMEAGEYLALLSHSGSRGLGANIAKHFTEIAKSKCLLPRQAGHLAWLDLNTEEGQQYWLAMNLAGDYAKACHDQIHYHLSKYMGIKPIVNIENHHNFAWKEVQENGEELIVHRKGATPAKKGELGIIPGSMTAPGYLVRGQGNSESLNSASHGAGRKMSRKMAKESYTGSAMKKDLSKAGVQLIGGGIDEAPVAYKDIDEVMKSQSELVEVIGKFTPKIVRMDKA